MIMVSFLYSILCCTIC